MRASSIFASLSLAIVLVISGCKSSPQAGKATQSVRQQLSSPAGDFTLTPPAGMQRMGHDSVPWSGSMPHSDDNGVVVYYFEEGASIALASPQIRVEYVAKALEGVGSAENLFTWLKGVFVNDDYQGKVISDQETVTTASGQAVKLLEIQTPNTKNPKGDGTERAGKNMIWAYVDRGDYLIGFSGTALSREEYQTLRKHFLAVLTSFSAE